MRSTTLSFNIDRYKLFKALLVSSCLVLFICFFTPLDIFFNNTKEFDYSLNDIYLYLLLISACLIAVLTLILISIPNPVFERVLSLLLAIIILLWIQGNVLNRDYGSLDGGEINWDKWATWGYIEAAIWGVLIIMTVIFSPYIEKIINKLCIVIILTFISTFVINYLEYSPPDAREIIFNESIKFDFSSDKNVILVLVDEVQSDVFYEIISENQFIKEQFSGFVYYPDTLAGFPFTETSVPNILTGEYYDNSIPLPEFIEKSYLGDSIPRVLKERGFEVDLIPTFYDDTILKSDLIASNLIEKGQITNIKEGLTHGIHLIDISLFRNAPHLLKRYVVNDNKWLLTNLLLRDKSKLSHLNWWSGDDNFYGEISKINDSIEAPVFKFFHLKGTHAPYNRNARGQPIRSSSTRESYKNFLIFNLKRLVSFLDELKSKGVYDNSIIYIFGDHGAGRSKELKINTELIEEHRDLRSRPIPLKIKARAIPLLMTKNPFSTGKLKISTEPVSLSDIPQMVFEDLNIKLDHVEGRMFVDESGSKNARKYLFWNHPFQDPSYEYNISGNAWLDSSWSGPNRVYTRDGSYERDFSVKFEPGDSGNYRINTSKPSENYKFESLGIGKYSITIKWVEPNSNYFLCFTLDNNIKLDDLNIDINVNDTRIKTIKVKKDSHITETPIYGVQIPSKYLRSKSLKIKISSREKSSSDIVNPFESIYLFRHHKA